MNLAAQYPVLFDAFASPLGELTATMANGRLLGLWFDRASEAHWRRDGQALAAVRQQLAEYFAGSRQHFELPLSPPGTEFQQRVWAALQQIPFGETRSYGEQSRLIGDPKAVRAVGLANGRNPIGIVIPCHRVIGADGSLTGYAGGIERKRWLLTHEAKFRSKTLFD